MKHLFFAVSFLLLFFSARADEYIATDHYVLDECSDYVHAADKVRSINGGTVIIPEFDASCPEIIKGAFSHACRIVEEYLPPCLPIRIRVSCAEISDGVTQPMSNIKFLVKENFGSYKGTSFSPLTRIKGVIASELAFDSQASYYPYIPDKNFLCGAPDIEITYNKKRLSEFSFSIDAAETEQFDFVTLAMGDILKGLGLTSRFKPNAANNELENPMGGMLPFESKIHKALGETNDSAQRLKNATKDELNISGGIHPLSLYAPSRWKEGVSLNYFIPVENCIISEILSHDFCKGLVYRSISDSYDNTIFGDLLQWNTTKASADLFSGRRYGSTELLLPYKGELTIDQNAYGITTQYKTNVPVKLHPAFPAGDSKREVKEYVESFHPFQSPDNLFKNSSGTAVALLKKDGTWDTVQFTISNSSEFTLSMSNWTMHHDIDEYARTSDGYLRGRLTSKVYFLDLIDKAPTCQYKTTYFIADYLPQRPGIVIVVNPDKEVDPTLGNDSKDLRAANPVPVRFYFSNTEGIDRIVMERLMEGKRAPSKLTLTDFKKGYHDNSITKNTTFTAVVYNANGATRSLPVYVMYPSEASAASSQAVSLSLDNEKITVTGDPKAAGYYYEIRSLSPSDMEIKDAGQAVDTVDISKLASGLYVITLYDNNGRVGQLKFVR